MDKNNEDVSFISIVLLIFIASASFYYQAIVTEERFVPALNVISKRLRISDDVAGATLMAAGASSPELFAALVSVFITHSALGTGTVVGSEIFNQLVIGAAAITDSKNQRLVLDPVIVIRDVTFYALSLILLFYAFLDRRIIDDSGEEYVFVSKFAASLLVGCYVLYVLVCGYFDKIMEFLRRKTNYTQGESYDAFDDSLACVPMKQMSPGRVSNLPFVRSWGGLEPAENFRTQKTSDHGESSSVVTELSVMEHHSDELGNVKEEKKVGTPKRFLLDRFAPNLASIDGIDDILQRDDGSVNLYLWQRSTFYDKARIDMHTWELKWFTFMESEISSISIRTKKYSTGNHDERPRVFPACTGIEVDAARRIIKISTAQRDYILLAPTDKHLDAATSAFERHFNACFDVTANDMGVRNSEQESLISYPRGMSKLEFLLYCVAFPLKAIVQFTIPDVRTNSSITPGVRATIAINLSILSLVVGSYVMVASLEDLADIFNIPSAIVGATVSAAGTSIPALISSQIAARLGLGNMAISNVFGSNTFNILVGLGLPWIMYTVAYDTEYHDLPATGINESMIAMGGTLVLFILLVLHSGFVLLKWHAWMFNMLYVLFVVHLIGQCFV
mmetsp:Transcript_13197/g.24796  ORF Transcript_13197/g.24796 Transcript_13197/m.24796 type:complete len:619 (-) Transcript_13197:35-1891(-)